jgi:hypothetical protein
MIEELSIRAWRGAVVYDRPEDHAEPQGGTQEARTPARWYIHAAEVAERVFRHSSASRK